MPQMNDQRRKNAIQVLTLLVAAGVPSAGAMPSAWVLDTVMTKNGLDEQELLSGLNYAAEQNWLTIAKTGLLLTKAGRAVTMQSRDIAA